MPERGKIYFIIVDFPHPPLENVKINSLVYWINDISGSRPPLFPPILGKKEKRRRWSAYKFWEIAPKGTVSRDFQHFCLSKTSTWAPYEHAKAVSQKKIFSKIVNNYIVMCQCSQRLCRHGVSVVNDYADMHFSKVSS